eukprot:96518-Alexandrium_andersonii.AAC.1
MSSMQIRTSRDHRTTIVLPKIAETNHSSSIRCHQTKHAWPPGSDYSAVSVNNKRFWSSIRGRAPTLAHLSSPILENTKWREAFEA